MLQEALNQLKLWFVNPDLQKKISPQQKRSMGYRLRRQYVWRIKAEMKKFRSALQAAENPIQPRRELLYAIYRQIELDDQVITQKRIATATVRNSIFEIRDKKENAIKEDKLLFERPWFRNYLKLAVETEFWGHTLIEFEPPKDGEFKHLVCLPREHVRPEYGDVVTNVNDQEGIEFRANPQFKFLIEIGTPHDLGLYQIVATPYIRKIYSDTDWSLYSEKFGMPLLAIQTSSMNEKEIDKKEEMAKNFGTNSYLILDDMDQVQIIEKQANNGHQVYHERILMADDQIAKTINGQTSTSDKQSFVGSAEVHERILNELTKDRLTDIQDDINFALIPFLISHGYPLQNKKFQFLELLEKEESKEDKKKSLEEKKKPSTLTGFIFP